MNFKIGFWNYVPVGTIDTKKAVSDWEELGMSLPMSFSYDASTHKKEDMLSMLDECHKKGMQVIVCDKRTNFRTLLKTQDRAAFEQGIKDAATDFGNHPAVFGFEVGDEPDKNSWEVALDTYKMVKAAAPHLTPFINMYPLWAGEQSFYDTMGVHTTDYGKKNADFMRRAGANLISYDCYSQCSFFEKDCKDYEKQEGIDLYFQNLNLFRTAAEENDGVFFNSILSVGHWAYREPTENDLRWQLSTSIAHGAQGVMWFFLYERRLDGSFRRPPIDLFWKRTPLFDELARQNRICNEYYLKGLDGYNFDKVWHYLWCYGNTPRFTGNEELTGIFHRVNPVPTAISRFVNSEGKTAYVIVNLSQTEPTKINPTFTGAKAKHNLSLWFAPGQMMVFTDETRV